MSGLARRAALPIVVAVGALSLGLAACGEEHHTEVIEGEPIELGDLRINVQLTRYLNPGDTEDSEYLEGQPPAPLGQDYLGVFMEVDNEGDEDVRLPGEDEMGIADTTGQHYSPIPSETVFAFPFGEVIAPGDELPEPDTAVAAGPIKGLLVLFLVNEDAPENRPLELEILADGEEGKVELDI